MGVPWSRRTTFTTVQATDSTSVSSICRSTARTESRVTPENPSSKSSSRAPGSKLET